MANRTIYRGFRRRSKVKAPTTQDLQYKGVQITNINVNRLVNDLARLEAFSAPKFSTDSK